jgi:hypothetical protein
MRLLFAMIVVFHGLIHLMGPAKGFGFAALPQLAQPISKPVALLWLLASLLCLATAVALFVRPESWWLVGALAVVASQTVIMTSLSDAKYGTVVNVIVLAGVVVGYFSRGVASALTK